MVLENLSALRQAYGTNLSGIWGDKTDDKADDPYVLFFLLTRLDIKYEVKSSEVVELAFPLKDGKQMKTYLSIVQSMHFSTSDIMGEHSFEIFVLSETSIEKNLWYNISKL